MAAHRHWRVLFPEVNSSIYVQLTEVEFRQAVGVPEIPTGGTAYASSVYGASYAASRAFDGNITTAWSTAGDQAINSWIAYDYGAGNEKDILEVAVRCDNGTSYAPKSIQIEYSDDGVGWFFYGWYGNQTGWAAREERLFLTYEPENQPTRFTQIQGYVVESSNKSVRFTQIQGYVVILPVQPARLTQVQNYVVATPRPVPPPGTILPLAPITEELQFLTSVNTARSSMEQRSRLRAVPRHRYSHNLHLQDDADWRVAFVDMYKNQNKEYTHPLYHYWTVIEQPADPVDTELFFDPAQTDMRDGETLAIFDVFTRKVTFHAIDTVTATGAILVEPVGRELNVAHRVCPALMSRMLEVPSMEKFERLGQARVTMETTRPRTFRRETDTTLLTLQNIPVLVDEPYGRSGENVNKGGQWIDSGLSVPDHWNTWRHGGRISGRRDYSFDRWVDMDHWRAILDHMGGRQRTIYVPSFYDDLPLAQQPALSATTLVTTEIQLYEMFQARMFGAVAIFRSNGTIYRSVLSTTMNYDVNGDPVSVNLALNQNIGAQPGSNVISKVSLLYKMRSTEDTIRMEHFQNHSTISLNLESVYQ